MSRVPTRNTAPERLVSQILRKSGFRLKQNVSSLPGSPDIVLTKCKTVIFIHGCFWHGHTKCKKGTMPTSRIEYWIPKITSNVKRDRQRRIDLKKLGWTVITIWQCEISSKKKQASYFKKLLTKLKKVRAAATG